MEDIKINKLKLQENGFEIIENIFSDEEIEKIFNIIENVDASKPTFRKTTDLFAIRQVLKEIPKLCGIIFNNKINQIIQEVFGKNYFVVKSIYFDKPEQSNWFVSYHQDLTISVDKKISTDGYGPWTVKQNQFAVQPPISILQNIYTIRIHLDDTDEQNGALKVIPTSHLKGIYRPETIDWTKETETFCKVSKGGLMIMRPLLLHASNKTTNNNKRRVLHIEFSNLELPSEINWAERINL
jgi:ectoine hydroxylase-related dioxygenase (phytanoyl-CoA dioxygenase family)